MKKKIVSFVVVLCMIFSCMPTNLTVFAESSSIVLNASKSITANVNTKTVTDTFSASYDAHSLYVYHSNWNQRNAYIGFDLKNAFTKEQLGVEYAVKKATVTVNCVEAVTVTDPVVALVAIDNTKWNESTYTETDVLNLPAYNVVTQLTNIPEGMVILDEVSVTGKGLYEFDVTEYVNDNYRALVNDGISFALINITRVADSGNHELLKVLFEGKNGSVKPTLTIEMAEQAIVNLSLKGEDGEVLGNTVIERLAAGGKYIPSEEDAPLVITKDGKLYVREALNDITLKLGENTVEVLYTVEEMEKLITGDGFFPVIDGDEPVLPKKMEALLSDGKTTVTVDVAWEKLDGMTYRASYNDISLDVTFEVLPSDGKGDTFLGAGDANGAIFTNYNKLNNIYGAGNVVFDCEFTVTEGGNKLISYGNDVTGDFGNAAALLRYANIDVFEYYNNGWRASGVQCETGKTYNLHTTLNMTNRTYRMYIAGEDGIYKEVTDGNAAFRGSITTVDRFFFHGSGILNDNSVIKSHNESWVDGFTNLTVNYVCDGNTVNSKTLQWGTGTSYTENVKVIGDGEKVYAIPDFDTLPVKSVVTGENDSFDIEVNAVAATVSEIEEVNLVQGDASIILPDEVEVAFENGASLVYPVVWNTEDVDTDNAGEYIARGLIDELKLEAECVVNVKAVENIEYTPDGNTVVTNNGGWNWYVEPSGTHIEPGDSLATLFESGVYSSNNGYKFKEDKTYMGWVEDGGDIVISSLDHNTGEHKRVVIHEKLESDDHNNPAVIVLPDGRIMAVYSMHTNEPYMYYRVTKYPEDISEWNDEQFYYCYTEVENATYNATYPSVFAVHDDCGIEGNDVIYMGWRGVHWKPTLAKFSIPDENGVMETVMGQTQFANTTYKNNTKGDGGARDGSRRPYTKYDYDVERNKIYMTFTATHPDNDTRNHIYYVELDIADQNLYTSDGRFLQPLPFENKEEYADKGANGTSGQWGIVTVDLVGAFPELLVFDASEQTGQSFNPGSGLVERRGWTWDIAHNEKGEPCIVYADITATPPGEGGKLPDWYVAPGDDNTDPEHATRAHHYYWYARWDKEKGEWVKTFLTYGGKWWHQNYTQERCYSGGLTFDHNYPGNVIFLSIPTYGKYGEIFEIYRWESDDDGETWTKREAITKDSPTPNARPNAIYNYKMDEDGKNLGPRLLWKSGEYRYWMNYEYKTGVWTDYATDGFITQDDPEMFADFALFGEDGEKLEVLPVGEDVTVTARFTISNISIGDGSAKLAFGHYSKDGILKKFEAVDAVIPARSVPQIGVVGAPKKTPDGSYSPWADVDNRSAMGDSEVVEEIDYTTAIEEGDRITLFAWGTGIEHPWHPLSDVNYSISTEGLRNLFTEDFSYDGEEILVLDGNPDTFNGWIGKGFNGEGEVAFDEYSYAGITKLPFGNTGLHLYRRGGEGIMASHALPDTNGEDYTIEFTLRYITEISWNNTNNIGFTLSHGTPQFRGDEENPSAYQFRHRTEWKNENGRGTSIFLKNSIAFDNGGAIGVAGTGIPRDLDVSGMEQVDYAKGVGYFDPETGTYIHDYNDSLMVGALYHVTVKVSPSEKTVEVAVNDGYRTTTHTADYNSKNSYNWEENPVDTITFSVGSERWGELCVDDIKMYLTENK